MTFEVDNEALKLAMARHYEEKLAKELREMFIYSGNEDTNRIWQLYLEEIQRKAEKEAELEKIELGHASLDKWGATGFMLCLLAYMVWTIWKLFTLTPT